MTNTEELLRSAVKKLGPERSQQAIEAFGNVWAAGNWSACALGRASDGGIRRRLDEVARIAADDFDFPWRIAAEVTGLTLKECRAVTDAFDNDEGVSHVLLKSLLEAEAAKATPRRTDDELRAAQAARPLYLNVLVP